MATTNLGKVAVVPKGEYSSAVQYERLDIVQYERSSYLVKQAVIGVTPTDGDNYALLAGKGDSSYDVAVNNGFIGTEAEWQLYLKSDGSIQALQQFMTSPASTEVSVPDYGNIPSLQGYISTMFENGGLPATPFATKALMTASALVDGKYAQVTDDIIHNGLYVKTAGAWVKSNYDPFKYSDDGINNLLTMLASEGGLQVNWKDYVIEGYVANYEHIGQPALRKLNGYNSIRIDVRNVSKIITNNAVYIGPFRWVFSDADGIVIARSDKLGNVELDVPDNAVYAVRGSYSESKGYVENEDMLLTLTPTVSMGDTQVIKDDLESLIVRVDDESERLDDLYTITVGDGLRELDWKSNIAQGTVNTNSGGLPIIVNEHLSYLGYTRINVKGLSSFTVSGAIETSSLLRWVFESADGEWLGIASGFGNKTYQVPEGAVWAYKTIYNTNTGLQENDDMKITTTLADSSLRQRIEVLEDSEGGGSDSPIVIPDELKDLIKVMETQLESGSTLKLSDFDGVSSDEKIRNGIAFIKERGYGILDLETGTHKVNSAVILPSNCWLYLNESTLQLNDGVFDNIIRNEGIVVGSGHGDLATEVNENVNIRVLGKDISSSFVKANRYAPYRAPRPLSEDLTPVVWLGDDYGWRTMGILFNNVKHFEIANFHMSETNCWAMCFQHGCQDFEIHHIDFNTNTKNGDGIDIMMGCKDGHVHHITGKTSDDILALTAIRNFRTELPAGNDIYSTHVAGWDDIGFGVDISNIKINDIVGSGVHNGVRLLATGGSRIHDVTIDHIEDESESNKFSAALIDIRTSGWGMATGRLDDIENIYINKVLAKGGRYAIKIHDTLANSHINYVRQSNPEQELVDSSTATLTNVTITNVK